MNYWPRAWSWFWWRGRTSSRVPFPIKRMLLCGKRRWYVRKGVDMRWPPLLTVNNFLQVSDAAYVQATTDVQRFPPFGMDACVIGPWLAASFDNATWQTGDPIMRFTLIGAPAHRIRTVASDTHGAVVRLADGASAQEWEVVSTLEWVPDGETIPAWVFCFARPRPVVAPVGGDACLTAMVGSLDTPFTMYAPGSTSRHVRFPSLPAGTYTVRWSIVCPSTSPPALWIEQDTCTIGGSPVSSLSGVTPIAIGAGHDLTVNLTAGLQWARMYVTVESPP